ncbi:MAG: tetratricopeptide repeat protein [Alphaproteobacteria bacterium]
MIKKRNETESKNHTNNASAEIDAVQRAFFREVDEDLQREQLKKFWEKYGTLVVVVVIAGLTFAACFEGWKAWRQEIRQRDSLAYERAQDFVDAKDTDNAVRALGDVAANASTGYAVIAALDKASLLIGSGKREEGIAELEAIYNNRSNDKAFRDLAAVKIAGYILDDGDKDKILSLIDPLVENNSSWRAVALELKALLLLREGNKVDAVNYFKSLMNDTGATQQIRARAVEMVSVLEDKNIQEKTGSDAN